MVAARSSGVVRPPLIDRCFLLIPVLPVAVLALVVSSVVVQLTQVATWVSAGAIGTTAALIVRTVWRTWNCRFSASDDLVESFGRFRTTKIPFASIRTCYPVQLHPGARDSPIVLGLIVEGRTEPLNIMATFRFQRAEREAVVRTMTELGICVERASEYTDQNEVL
jgi:hypothetical protein